MRRIRCFLVLFTAVALGGAAQPVIAADPPPPATPEVLATVAGVTSFAAWSQDLAAASALGERLPFVRVTPGSAAGLGLGDLLDKAIAQRLTAADPRTFADLDNAIATGGLDLADGRHITVDASVDEPATGTVKTLTVNLRAERTVDAALDIASTTPRVDLHSAAGVKTVLGLEAHLRFAYDTATNTFFVAAGDDTPRLAVTADASIPDPAAVTAAVGLLEVRLTSSSFDLSHRLAGVFEDPDRDGRLAFTEPAGGGVPGPGELATATAPELVDIRIPSAPAPLSTVSGTLGIGTKPSSVPGLVVPSVTASVSLKSDNLATTKPVVTTENFDTVMRRFQQVTPAHLLDSVARVAAITEAAFAEGDPKLPFLHGTISETLPATERLRSFLAASVDAEGAPKFATLQEFFARLDASDIDVTGGAYDAANARISFTLKAARSDTAAGALAQAGSRLGAVEIGNALADATGIVVDPAPASAAKAKRAYTLVAPLSIDLRDAVTGDACKTAGDPTNSTNAACPFAVALKNPSGQTMSQTIVEELPTAVDRFLLKTGATLADASADITADPAGAAAAAGFLGLSVASGAVSVKPSLTVTTKDQGDVRLTELGRQLVSPTSPVTRTLTGAASLSAVVSVPGAPDFFANPAVSPKATVTIADLGAPAVDAPGLAARVKPFAFAGAAEPAALRGKVAGALGALATSLGDLPALATGATRDRLATSIQVIGRPFAGFVAAPELRAAVDALAAAPPDRLQQVLTTLNTKLGANSASIRTDGTRLLLDLVYQRSLASTSDPAFGLSYPDGGAAGTLVGTGANGTIDVGGTTNAAVTLAIPLSTSADPRDASSTLVLPSSTLTVSPTVSTDTASITATAGALPITLGPSGRPARIQAHPTLTLKSTGTDPVSLAQWASSATAELGAGAQTCPTGETNLAICAVLPAADSKGADIGEFTAKLAAADVLASGTAGVTAPGGLGAAQGGAPLPLGSLAEGADNFLRQLTASLVDGAAGGRLPLVGDFLEDAKFIDGLSGDLLPDLKALPSTDQAGLKVKDVRARLNELSTKVAGAKTVTPGLTCGDDDHVCAAADDDKPASTISGVTLRLVVGSGAPAGGAGCTTGCTSTTQAFDIGIPGLRLKGDTGPKLDVGWEVDVTLGMDREAGLYVDTGAARELKVGMKATLPKELKATVAFVEMTAKSTVDTPAFAGEVGFDLQAPSGNRLTLADLANGLAGARVVPTLQGDAVIEWDLAAVVSSALPGLGAHFSLRWGWSNTDPANAAALKIEFSNVVLKTKDFFEETLGPLYKEVKSAIEPLKPVVDAINAPIPGISDVSRLVGGGDISLLTLMQLYGKFGNPSFEALERVIRLVSTLVEFSVNDGDISLGKFSVKSDKAMAGPSSPEQAQDLIDTTGLVNPETLMATLKTKCAACAVIVDKLTKELGVGEDQMGFAFPVFQKPALLAGLLVGQDVPLATYDTGPFEKKFEFFVAIGPIPIPLPLFIDIGAGANIYLRFKAGFDTYGIRKAIEEKKAVKLLDSFYLQDWDEKTNAEVPEIRVFDAGPFVRGVIRLGILEGGVAATIRLDASLDLKDVLADGKVRASEFGRDGDGDFNFACIFDAKGDISATVALYLLIKPLVFPDIKISYPLASAKILDLEHSCDKPQPDLGTVSGGDLVVKMGAKGPGGGKDESAVVRALHTTDSARKFTGFSVELRGQYQEFLVEKHPGLNRVVIDARGYKGVQNVNLLGDGSGTAPGDKAAVSPFDRPAIVLGGDADDHIKVDAPKGVSIAVDGGGGNDTIIVGAGDDLVSGGSGADTMTLGGGNDNAWGDAPLTLAGYTATKPADPDAAAHGDGVDKVEGGAGADYIHGGKGDDVLKGGSDTGTAAVDPSGLDNDNTLVGGPGADTLAGGQGHDTLFGDFAEKVDGEGTDGGGDDMIDTGTGNDDVWAGRGNDKVVGHSVVGTVDTIYGNGGDDEVVGGDGHDVIYAGPGNDGPSKGVLGGLGDDLIHGGTGNDRLGGDRTITAPGAGVVVGPFGIPRFTLLRASFNSNDGDDRIYGDADSDTVYAGGGDDVVYGDTGAAACAPPLAGELASTPPAEPAVDVDRGDTLAGGPGEDRISGEGGVDQIDGGDANDLLCGHGAGDVISGMGGADTVWAGSGEDRIFGGNGIDTLYGNDDNDTAFAGPDADQVEGNAGNDTLFGESGDDRMQGNAGADSVFGQAGQDNIFGGSILAGTDDTGDPLLSGGDDQDVVLGDNGTVTAGAGVDPNDGFRNRTASLLDAETIGGPDKIAGDGRGDRLYGGLADDVMDGGSGDDRMEGNAGRDTMRGTGNEDDMIGGSSAVNPLAVKSDVGEIVMHGDDGPDVMIGDNGEIVRPVDSAGKWLPDPVTGGVKRTVLLADREKTGAALALVSGGDVVHGDNGNDRMFGQGGADMLYGGDQDDQVQGNQDGDLVEGNAHEDDLIGGSDLISTPTSAGGAGDPDAADFVYGGPGADVLTGDNAIVTRLKNDPGAPYDYETYQIGIRNTRWVRLLDKAEPPAADRFGGDQLSGGSGVDVMFGQDGRDLLSGGSEDDYQEGNGDLDRLWGDRLLSDVGVESVPEPLASARSAFDSLQGAQGPHGQDDQIGGSSIKGFRDTGDFIYGDGAADFQLGDNGQLVRTITAGDYVRYVEANTTTAVRQPDRYDVNGPAATHGGDWMEGNDGDDYQYGQDGNDTQYGGNDNDDMYGELDDDRMFGERGEDAMVGDRGVITDRLIDGSTGDPAAFNVTIKGPPGVTYTGFRPGTLDRRVDLLADGDGDMDGDGNAVESPGLRFGGGDFMKGGPDRDSMHGAFGDDLMNGDSGGDLVFGDDGADALWGGRGGDDPNNAADRGVNDSLVDVVFGGRGGDPANDQGLVTGGADVIDYRPRAGVDPEPWFEITGTRATDTLDDRQHHQGIDWQYGGWDRDVMQGDVTANGPNDGDRMLDWVGAYNLYTGCNPAYGGYNDVRQHSPHMQDFLERLAWASGVGTSLADVRNPASSAYRELAMVYVKDISPENSGKAYPTTPGHFDQNSCLP